MTIPLPGLKQVRKTGGKNSHTLLLLLLQPPQRKKKQREVPVRVDVQLARLQLSSASLFDEDRA